MAADKTTSGGSDTPPDSDEEKQAQFDELVAAGISEAEARELVWPAAESDPPKSDPSLEPPLEPPAEAPPAPPVEETRPTTEPSAGLAFMRAPAGVSGCSFDGKEYAVDAAGLVEVPVPAIRSLAEHGFTVVTEEV